MTRFLTHHLSWLAPALLFAWMPVRAAVAGEAGVLLRLPGTTTQSVACVRQAGVSLVSVSGCAQSLGCAWQWESSAGKMSLSRDSFNIALCEDVTVYSLNGMIRQLPVAPVRIGAWLYLSAPAVCELFEPFVKSGLHWNAVAQTIEPLPSPASTQVDALPADSASAPIAVKKVPDSSTAVRSVRDSIKTVVIDPGHGGHDPGAIGPTGVQEKDVVLKIGLELRDLLRKKPGFTVCMTREKDVFIPLQKRTRFANDKKADIFVSIHANSIGGNKAKKKETRGYKVYFLSQAKNEEDKLAAMRENAVVELEHSPKGMDDLQSIIIEMVNNEYLIESQELSIMIDTMLQSANSRIDRLHLGVGQAPFWVLNGAYMPSVLVEVGFISNDNEEKLLKDPAVLQRIAKGLFNAVMAFKQKYEAEHE